MMGLYGIRILWPWLWLGADSWGSFWLSDHFYAYIKISKKYNYDSHEQVWEQVFDSFSPSNFLVFFWYPRIIQVFWSWPCEFWFFLVRNGYFIMSICHYFRQKAKSSLFERTKSVEETFRVQKIVFDEKYFEKYKSLSFFFGSNWWKST